MTKSEGVPLRVKVAEGEERSCEDVLGKALGEAGPWQYGILALIGYLMLSLVIPLLGIVFLGPPVDYHCTGTPDVKCNNGSHECTSWQYDQSVFIETIVTKVFLLTTSRVTILGRLI